MLSLRSFTIPICANTAFPVSTKRRKSSVALLGTFESGLAGESASCPSQFVVAAASSHSENSILRIIEVESGPRRYTSAVRVMTRNSSDEVARMREHYAATGFEYIEDSALHIRRKSPNFTLLLECLQRKNCLNM